MLMVSACVVIAGVGCKKSSNSNTDTGKLYLHLHTNIDTNEVASYGTVYTTGVGRKVSLTKAQLYISNIQLVKQDGSIYSVPNVILLKQLDPEQYYVANVPVGNYKSVKFSVGLDATANQKASTADSNLNHADMWFGASAQPNGYVFVNVQGTIDTTTNAMGTVSQMQPFTYMIGTNAHLNQVSMPDHSPVYNVIKDQTTFVHIIIDYNKLFNGVQLNKGGNLMVMSASDNTSAISNTISSNVPFMFSYEE